MSAALARPVWVAVACLVLATATPPDAARRSSRAPAPDSARVSTSLRPARDARTRRPVTRGSSRRVGPAGTPVRTVGVTVTVIPATTQPITFGLDQNFPNPVDAHTAIGYAIPAAAHVSLDVFDVAGKRVARLVSGDQDPGRYVARWNRAGDDGHRVRAGVYYYRLTTYYRAGGRWSATRKIALR